MSKHQVPAEGVLICAALAVGGCRSDPSVFSAAQGLLESEFDATQRAAISVIDESEKRI